VFAHGLLFVDSGFDYPELLAIRPEERAATQLTLTSWTTKKGVLQTASMVVVGDELYYVSDAGIAACVDARNGQVHWSERLGGNMSASPVVAEGRLYFQNETGIGYVVQAAKTYTLLATNDLGEPTLASPAVIDGALYLRSDKHVENR
jgi:outer membrane protein assembly factor BamB